MKQVIDGKRYNTETAEEIAAYRSSYPRSDFKWYEETLYRTPRGNWFLAGEGHAMSPYSEPVGDMQGSGSGIRVLSKTEAREWLERNEETDAIEEHFADEIEDA